MNIVNVSLIVIPADIDQQRCQGCDPARIGNKFSSDSSIDVITMPEGLTILYRDDVIGDMEADVLGANIIKIFETSLPSTTGIRMHILYNFHDASNPMSIKFNEDAGMLILNLSNYFYENRTDRFDYVSTTSVMEVSSLIKKAAEEDEGNEFPDGFIPGYNQSNDNDSSNGCDMGSALSVMESMVGKNKKESKKSKKHYSESRLVANGKSPKRDYSRHGVVISRDKKDYEKDAKIIKDFLKDFIPGSARWKRDFRDDLLERWMKAFVIRKKKLRKLEKKMHHKKKSKKKPSPGQIMAMDFTRRMVSATDPWNNPNK